MVEGPHACEAARAGEMTEVRGGCKQDLPKVPIEGTDPVG